MKTIGMLGGMSWESTANYYRLINEGIKAKLGGLHSGKICMLSVDFDEIEKLQHAGNWVGAGEALATASQSIEAGGADFLIICTNTMHKVVDQVEDSVSIPILHIADATAECLREQGISKVGLLGTAFTMEQDFYKGRIQDNFGIEVIVPETEERKSIHRVIYEELCLGKILPESKQLFLKVIENLKANGAEGIILGCTEISMLVAQEDTNIQLFDTAAIHAESAVKFAIAG